MGAGLRPRRARGADGRGAGGAWGGELLRELNRFCNTGDREILTRLLERRNGTRTHEITAIGHAHIDTAWLWPLEETYRKCVRTFATQLRLMERYPDYRFACSQAQQYAWIRDREPGLWARIQRAVERGQWLPVGGTWVEPDCNLPAGESLVRQFLYGQRFFEREFGRRAEVFWNPDVFGYNGQLPQLMRGAGISGFLTQKLSWNRFNDARRTTRSAGSASTARSVLAHFPPADTYNAEATVPELRRAARDFKDHERSAQSLLRVRLGRRRRRADGGDARDAGARRGPSGRPAHDDRRPRGVLRRARASSEWPEVVGELYFEYHRGTYTTQARTKRASRRAERALHDAELLAAVAGEPAGLEDAWQTLLLNHFHDILPGSSIGEVHARAERDLAEVEAAAGAVRDRLLPRRRREHDRRRAARGRRALRARRSPRRRRAASGASSRRGAGQRRRRRGPSSSTTGSSARSSAATGRCARSSPAAARRWLRPATCSSSTTTARPTSRPGTSTRSTSRPAPTARPRRPPRSRSPIRCALEVAFERPIGDRSRMRQTVRLDAEAPRLEFHCAIDWQRGPEGPEGALPSRRARAAGDLRDAVRRRRAPDHYSTRADARAVRGARPSLRRSLGARLRRRAALGGDLRLVDARRRDADDPAPLAALARPGRRPRRPRARLRGLPARGRMAGRRGDRRGAALQRAAAGRRADAAPGCWFAREGSWSTPSSRPRTATASSCGCTRRTAAAGGRGCASASRSPKPISPICLRTASRPPSATATRIVPYRPFAIVTVALSRPR